ncbi:MAG: response regulator transcription factor, partial [Clostridia bacterium]|nr:response regulator transcription factor [Clostridia bacterium]
YKAEYDVVFMDIDMPLMNGMEAAKKLRKVDGYVPLVFITDLKQYALKGYEVEAMDFLVKPVTYAAFSTMLDRVRRRVQQGEQTLLLTTAQGVFKTSVDDVLFVEMQNHYVNYHTTSGRFSFFGSLSEEEKRLPAKKFARCNSGYIVNLARVDKVQDGCVYIGGDCLPISRSKKASFMQSLFDFIGHN